MVIDPSKDDCPDLDENLLNDEELEETYFEYLANGKKNLLCSDYSEAVSCFQAAATLQSERFGDTAPECAEAFFYYGKALLELARTENAVLGNALKVPKTEDSESETDDQFEKTKYIPAISKESEQMRDVEAAMATKDDHSVTEDDSSVINEAFSKESSGKSKGRQEQASQIDTTAKAENSYENKKTDEACEPLSDADKTATIDEVDSLQENPDDIPNMQLAWEMLEMAKLLYTKKPESDNSSLMIAQCHLKLGELGLEVEDYTQAIGDLNECLTIQQKLLTNNDRRLAETHYNLGLSYSFDHNLDQSLEHYRSALQVLELRIDHLNQVIDSNGNKDEKMVMDESNEVGEIKALLPDINSKIEDVLLMKRQKERYALAFGTSSSSTHGCKVKPNEGESSSLSTNQTATNDISHLIRRKRSAPENEISNTDAKIKKLKTEVSNPRSVNTTDDNSKA